MIKQFKRVLEYEIISRVFCDKCGKEMHPTGTMYTTYPAYYEYKCPACKHKTELQERELASEQVYTETEYEEPEDEEPEDKD